ncbi:hypothetical protein F53441_6664 [Fusarium austroafricanum]|uniref:Zn(2)-C6 fungal-type domain-containing protein n=1 Tax=Fusarium austroafricanum TaxID=2364996 RepID=A0A8H4NYE3_9HYPO|nr:hypothetical protein F53441_6664 [Fusarium austroafricanum]
MSGCVVLNSQHAQQPFVSGTHLYRDVAELHAVPSPSHGALMYQSHFDDSAFAYHGLPDQSSLASLADHAHASQSPTAFPQHQAMPGLAHNCLPFGTLPTGNQSQSMDDSEAPPYRTSPASNTREDLTTDEFGLASRSRSDGADLGGKPKEDKADATPAWSELKTKAGKKRKHLPLACIACRRKKIRCSGEKPACKQCLRIPCVYKVTTRKVAPRANYMAMLDKRLKRMEERIIKVIPKSDQEVASSVTRAVVKPVIPGTAPSNKPTKERGAEEALVPDLEAWAKAPSKPKIDGDDRPRASRRGIFRQHIWSLVLGDQGVGGIEAGAGLFDALFESTNIDVGGLSVQGIDTSSDLVQECLCLIEASLSSSRLLYEARLRREASVS